MKKICVVIGARPQFIKHAPVEIELKKFFNVISIHTGQHYDEKMSDIFFNQLNIDKPSYLLSVGSATHGKQTGQMLEKIEDILFRECPDAVLVYGDTNSTLSGSLAASKLQIPLIHVEAGLRSFNKSMPEEQNRIITDHISDILFAPTITAVKNLENEGVSAKKIFLTGDVMYDSILLATKVNGNQFVPNKHILVTLHRPYNTDIPERLRRILMALNAIGKKIIFPIHPRTKAVLNNNNIAIEQYPNIHFCEPVSYFDLIRLQIEASCIITDSGGVQKEAYLLKRKCITLRSETEWIETLKNGWNTLVFDNLEDLEQAIMIAPGEYIENIYGDGSAAVKIAAIIKELL
jgi:UDP-GlcNAc3NAcA epimerase